MVAMAPAKLKYWRRRHFPGKSDRASLNAAASWYGVTRRAWQHWEAGTRPVPSPLLNRIQAGY